MINITGIKNKTKILKESIEENIFFGFGNQQKLTWFIVKNKKMFLPKGSKILFEIKGVYTNDSIKTKDSYPQIDDVISLSNGEKIKIIDIKWI